jgi:hypothetical protein
MSFIFLSWSRGSCIVSLTCGYSKIVTVLIFAYWYVENVARQKATSAYVSIIQKHQLGTGFHPMFGSNSTRSLLQKHRFHNLIVTNLEVSVVTGAKNNVRSLSWPRAENFGNVDCNKILRCSMSKYIQRWTGATIRPSSLR